MKNISKTLILCLTLAGGLTSCYDEMDSKESIDQLYEANDAPTVSVSSASATSFSSIEVNGSVSTDQNILETGVMVSTSADFATYSTYPSEEVSTTFTIAIPSLNDNTTYYVRAYAVGRSNTAVSESKEIKTPIAPIFDLNGTYSVQQYYYDDDAGEWTLDDSYEVEIAFEEGSTDKVTISNVFGGGTVIKGIYNETKSLISVAAEQIIMNHNKYGEVFMLPVNNAMASYVDNATFTFQSKGGYMSSSIWQARCSAGSFGMYKLSMAHK